MPKEIRGISYPSLVLKQDKQISELMEHCGKRDMSTTGIWCLHSDQEAIRQCQKKYCPILKDGYLYKDGE